MNNKRQCNGRVSLPNRKERQCKLTAQLGSEFCHKHQYQGNVPSGTPVTTSSSTKLAETASNPFSIIESQSQNILRMPNKIFTSLLFETETRLYIPKEYIEKDIYVTDTIRLAVVQSKKYPNAQVVFLGGTALAKGGFVNRFSEDIDIRIVPPINSLFPYTSKREIYKELIDNTLLAETNLKRVEHTSGTFYSKVILSYNAEHYPNKNAFITELKAGEIKIDYAIRSLPTQYQEYRKINSYIGETAALIAPELVDRYPVLQPFEVLTAKPIASLVDKLAVINLYAEINDYKRLAGRARDIFDTASLLRNSTVLNTVNSTEISALYNDRVKNMPSAFGREPYNRPASGFAASKAFQHGDPACEALREAYPIVKQYMYSDDDWIEFDDALEIIKNNSHLL